MSVKQRSERGKGSLFFEKGSNRWVVVLPLPKGIDGKRRRLKRTFKTKAEAMSFSTEGCTQQPKQIDLTVSDLLDVWHERLSRRAETGSLAPKTLARYSNAATHLRSSLGSYPASDVSVDDVERFLSKQTHDRRFPQPAKANEDLSP